MGIFETSLKITTLCVQHHVWLLTLDNASSKVFLQVTHSKLHQTWQLLISFLLGIFTSYDSKIDYKWMFRIFYCHKLNDLYNQWFTKQQLVCFSQKSEYSTIDIFKLWHHLLKIITQIFLLSFWSFFKFLFMFCSWITSISSLDMRFLLGGIYVVEKFLDRSSTFLNIGFWEILKGRPSEIIRSAIVIIRWVSLEVIFF